MTAVFSADRRYRYSLSRWTGRGDLLGDGNVSTIIPSIAFVMLNPSTANEEDDDRTIRRCIGYAEREGFGRLDVVNLFAYRSTDPKALGIARDSGRDIIGPDNDVYILDVARRAAVIVLAWGARKFWERDAWVLGLLRPYADKLRCLDRSRDGHPRHPLYIRKDAPLQPFKIER